MIFFFIANDPFIAHFVCFTGSELFLQQREYILLKIPFDWLIDYIYNVNGIKQSNGMSSKRTSLAQQVATIYLYLRPWKVYRWTDGRRAIRKAHLSFQLRWAKKAESIDQISINYNHLNQDWIVLILHLYPISQRVGARLIIWAFVFVQLQDSSAKSGETQSTVSGRSGLTVTGFKFRFS